MAAPAPPVSSCPSCHRPVDPSQRFCPSCGAALSAPAPASRPVDIRTQVDQDRGVLKRLQLLLPGFRGYREGEDVRAADSYLRFQVADRLHLALGTVQAYRERLTNAGQFQSLTDLSGVIADLQRIEGEVRHAEQGYAGISPSVRVQPAVLDRLYEYDFGFVQAADELRRSLAPLEAGAPASDAASVAASVQLVRSQVTQLEAAFRARIRAVQGIQVQ
ncbi:MAG: zinc ribbon domain-containing protein [Thermoplasmata archaeon]|nr:zinc ribbon domain-containing protein [Thermoplasmata archaeon]